LEINKINGTYSCGDLIVAPRLPVVWLQLAWEIMLRQDLLDILFYEGKVERDWFLKTYSAPEMTTYGCFVKTGLDPDALQLAGFGRVMPYPMGNNLWKAEIAVMFFKEYQSRKYTLPFCRMMIEHVFDNLVFRAIFGTTPLQNRAMLRFIKALGFGGTEVPCFTTWNGEPCGIYLSWMLKEDWKALREKA
jgi:RimJ/RimL family protein N-acetyltransferase